jgi:hypothetical protein
MMAKRRSLTLAWLSMLHQAALVGRAFVDAAVPSASPCAVAAVAAAGIVFVKAPPVRKVPGMVQLSTLSRPP